jgi:excisionase family DNA binding protein
MTTTAADLPEVLTVDEAARLLRIGRNNAYALAREWLASGGAHGLPVVKLGRSLRVPRAALQRMLDAAAASSAQA